ncbi:hypothetical protein EJ913_29955 [Azospirillum doebereinerae]|uniref:Uncharacterized protein n=1 Tax=Azospirillum doebereinerae TaxID=92933 RepID=A0A433IZM6_9PROT|nr:hypothetical protein EJ913_29955 [Azospirillum doebereinerae]
MAQYDIRPDAEGTGWTVFNVETGHPAFINDAPQIGMRLIDADDLAELLTFVESRRVARPLH